MTATLETRTLEVGGSLGVGEVEEALADAQGLGGEGVEWHLDLTATRYVQPFAGTRLAASLRSFARERLVVTLPEISKDRRARYRVLHRSGLLAAIAAHASEVRGETDATLERLRENPFANEVNRNYVLFNRVDDGGLLATRNRFASKLLRAISVSMPGVRQGLVDDGVIEGIIQTGYEGVANVEDHAYRSPYEGEGERVAYCLLSWEKEFSSSKTDAEGLAGYRSRALEHFDDSRLRWFMLAVVDDGVGIAARQSGDREIYDSPLAEEERALTEALERGGTAKRGLLSDSILRGDPGWGMELIAEALREASGYGCLRSGRNLVELDAFGASREWRLRPQRYATLRGTVLQIALPVPNPQLRLV